MQLAHPLMKAVPYTAGPLLGLAAFCPLYYFSLAGSWLPHLLLLCLPWLGWLLVRGNSLAAGWLCAWMLLASWVLVPQVQHPVQTAGNPATGSAQLRLAQVNLLQINGQHRQVSQQLKALDADIIAFQEVDEAWADSLVEKLAATYPYFSLAPQSNNYGMALFSKIPLKEVQLRLWQGYPAISAKVEAAGQDTLILSLHAASPITRTRFRARNQQLKAAARLIKEAKLPTLVLGDLNTVPWDSALQPLLKAAGLQDSRGTHYTATWPSPLGKWGIPIDYVLHSSHWQRISHRSIPIPGSDHKAMLATLSMQQSTAEPFRLTATQP